MRVHESGRISVDINGYIVDMNVSIPIRYQQQVATIDEDKVNVIGDVTHRLVLTPDIHNYSLRVCCITVSFQSNKQSTNYSAFIARFFRARRRMSLWCVRTAFWSSAKGRQW